jgi:hypothetical protein
MLVGVKWNVVTSNNRTQVLELRSGVNESLHVAPQV